MRLPFKPSVNKINGNYYLVPSRAGTPYKTIIKCDERMAKIVNLLGSNISEARMITEAKEILTDLTLEDITIAVKKAREIIGSYEFKENVLEVIEI
ncbi:MAG: hypothetical protein U0M60_01670 [Clostridia bacterium]|nr:hypothetical protein [Clostridia bacterium]